MKRFLSMLALGACLLSLATTGSGVQALGATIDDSPVARAAAPAASTRATSATPPKVRHVFVINIENESADSTYGPDSPAPYLAKTLRSKGVFLSSYYGVAHNSLPNYIAQISGQGPNPVTQSDCQLFMDFAQVSTNADGQAMGSGCVYPTAVDTLPRQLTRAGLSWKGYMEDMSGSCEHPALNQRDQTQSATADSQYAARHNPFVYFHGVIDDAAYCAKHVQTLPHLASDLRQVSTTPNLTYITPDLCSDGHDTPCADGRPGGLRSVNAFMRTYVPKILASPAFKKDGLLILTADESETDDTTACCGEVAANSPAAGIRGPGGGVIGTVVISPFTKAGTTSTTPYNHYSMLASIEKVFGLKALGYAASVTPFGTDVYNGKRVANRRPIARVRVTPASRRVVAGGLVRFSAAGSSDVETPGRLSYRWTFDGSTVVHRGRTTSHRWGRPGRHHARVVVTDPGGLRAVRTVYVTVTRPA